MFDSPVPVVQGNQYNFKLTFTGDNISGIGLRQRDNPTVGGNLLMGFSTSGFPNATALFVALDDQPWLTGSPGAATVGTPFSFTPTVTDNAVPAISFARAAGTTLPSWLQLNTVTGELSGTPPAPGSTLVTLVGTDAVGRQSTLPVTIVAAPAPVQAVLSGTAGPATAGVLFSFTPTVNADATQPLGFVEAPGTTLPSWLQLNAATGELTGTPPAAGTTTVQIIASNALAGDSAPLTVTIVANAAAPVAVPTLSEWGFALLGLLAAALGGRRLRQRRA
ncbi:IPTL-CTERM sorting domain-containing protein [Ottowia flava]|uniref:IPTL-CTERM sorting domain-containing protein n=1 Tax=Ottowia flava TaxID=2675430 RepID=A0ABW4KWA6_9BURK|nr:IPTL-CTERM sorting domain-containing protein [Ottowia sp. GY511]